MKQRTIAQLEEINTEVSKLASNLDRINHLLVSIEELCTRLDSKIVSLVRDKKDDNNVPTSKPKRKAPIHNYLVESRAQFESQVVQSVNTLQVGDTYDGRIIVAVDRTAGLLKVVSNEPGAEPEWIDPGKLYPDWKLERLNRLSRGDQ